MTCFTLPVQRALVERQLQFRELRLAEVEKEMSTEKQLTSKLFDDVSSLILPSSAKLYITRGLQYYKSAALWHYGLDVCFGCVLFT